MPKKPTIEQSFKVASRIIKKIKPCDPSHTIARDDPPTSKDIEKVEKKLRRTIPKSFKDLLTGGTVAINWIMDSLSDDLPNEYDAFCSGGYHCTVNSLLGPEGDKQALLKKARASKTNKEVWNNAFAFMFVIYTDSFIAVEIDQDGMCGKVLVLEAKGKAIKGSHVLAPDLNTFFEQWAELAFVELSGESLATLTKNNTVKFGSKTPFVKKWLTWLTTR